MGAGSSTIQNVTVIESADPNADAKDIIQMFPNFIAEKGEEESEEESESVALVGLMDSSDEPTALGGTLLILSPRNSSNKPSSRTIQTLVLSKDIIGSALQQCPGTKATVTACNTLTFSSPDRSFTYAVILLGGGASVLLVPPEILSFTQGRLAVAKIAAPVPHESRNHLPNNAVPEDTFAEIANNNVDQPIHNMCTSTIEPPVTGISDGTDVINEMEGILEQQYDLPKFPSLAVSVMQQNGQMKPNLPLNSRVGVPVETDLFIGSIILILRPPNPEIDPFYNERIFSKKRRLLIFQLQGKFKRVPKGTLFAGAEVSEQMKLGLVSKGLSSILLKLMGRFYPDMHHSFGDKQNVEQAHIVFPAWQFFGNIIATKPGDIPPPISQPFAEPQESINARKASDGTGKWNTDDTFSLSFHTMNLDLPTWRAVQIPVTRDLDLRTFWGNSLLSIVLYETRDLGREKRHIKKNNTYFCSVQVKFLGNDAASDSGDVLNEDEDILPWNNAQPPIRSDDALDRHDEKKSKMFLIDDTDNSDSEDSFHDAQVDVGLSNTDDAGFMDARSTMRNSILLQPKNPSLINNVCPAWIEISSPKGRITTVYAFNVREGSKTIYRTSSQFTHHFETEDATRSVEASYSSRMSSREKKRRIMGQALAHAISSEESGMKEKIHNFMNQKDEFESTFLQKPLSLLTSLKINSTSLCNVARALSEHHFVEEFARVTADHITFYQYQRNRPVFHFRMSIETIVNARKLCRDASPHFPQHYFMALETLGRTIYLMFLSESERNSWVDALVKLSSSPSLESRGCVIQMPQSPGNSEGSDTRSCISYDALLMVDDPIEEFLHKSSSWRCRKRRILNCRQFSFGGLDQRLDPSALVGEALRRALSPTEEDSEDENLRAFLDSASALKNVDVNQLNEKERMAFFLNLYHVMIMHTFLVLGTPGSTLKWIACFNTIAYQCSDDIFTLSELEHCIIRSAMNYPSQIVSKIVLPKSRYRFALTQADYRINFALNCGSPSCPGNVPIYTASSLDKALDYTAYSYLQQTVMAWPRAKNGVVLSLPRVCRWFSEDFGNGSTGDVLRLVKKFLDDDKQKLLSNTNITVKYLPFIYECRQLVLAETTRASLMGLKS